MKEIKNIISVFKLNYSEINAEMRKYLTKCPNCGHTNNRVSYKYIKPNGLWAYDIICNECNNVLVSDKNYPR